MIRDPELAEFEERRRANLKTLAMVGLIAVCGVLLWRCTSVVDRYGLHPGTAAKVEKVESRSLDIAIEQRGVSVRGCSDTLENCIAKHKVRERNREGGPDNRAHLHVAPDASRDAVAEVRALVASFELVPVLH